MKRSRVILSLTPLLVVLTFAAASCGAGKSGGDSKKPVSTYDPNTEEDGGGPTAEPPSLDASPLEIDGALNPLRRVENTAQALQILITAYDLQIDEGEIGKTEGTTPPMKAFAADVVDEGKAGKARIRQVAANKRVTPARSMLNDQLKFESAASMSHLRNTFRNMFNANWCTRQIEAASSLVRTIDQDLAPLMQDDEALSQALATTRTEAEKRMERAQAVKAGLAQVGSSDGMFPEPDEPEPQPQPEPAAEDDGDDDP